MTPSQIISLARDLFLVAAIGWLAWFVYHAGQNAEIKRDLAALQKQLAVNAQKQAQWAQEARDAEAQRVADMQGVAAAILDQHRPLIVRVPTSGGAVPAGPAPPAGGTACAGRAAEGSGRDLDVRAAVNGFELKYEGYLAACRSVLAQWPQ